MKKSRIYFFRTFQEADDFNAREMAALSGEQHLCNATELIKRLYAEELKKTMDKDIHLGKSLWK